MCACYYTLPDHAQTSSCSDEDQINDNNLSVFYQRRRQKNDRFGPLAIAARHIEQKKIVVIDADAGQHSALGWSAALPKLKLPVFAVDDTRGLVEVILVAAKNGYEFCFVDTPPRSPALALDALDRSDLVVVPAQVGLTDRLSTYASIDRVVASTRPYLVALSDAPARYTGRSSVASPDVCEFGLDGVVPGKTSRLRGAT